MLRHLLFLFSSALTLTSLAQVTVFSDDFESGSSSWTAADDLLPNFWTVNGCSGNGTSAPGSAAAYITDGSTVAACTPGLTYVNSTGGTFQATYYVTVDASCVNALQLSFDYLIDGIPGEDIARVVYSSNGGVSWTQTGSDLSASSSWTSTSLGLPPALDGTTFLLGFRFVYNDANTNGSPLAIDNILVNGTDNIAPNLTCPPDTNIYVDANCDGLVGNYLGEVVVSDNCSSVGNILLTQNPPAGTVVSGTIVVTPITISATDESGNTVSCQFDTRTIDTLVATIICPVDTNLYVAGTCNYVLPDFTGEAVASDNCTPPSSLTVSQNPLPGITLTGDQVVTLTVSGAIPNIDQSCTFTAFLVDTVSPNIVCPVPSDLYLDGTCAALLPDYTGSAIVNDNCGSPITVTQSPAPGSSVNGTSGVSISLTVTDASGNTDVCVFNQALIDTISPVINCPVNQSEPGDANCFAILGNYVALASATDNCSGVINYAQSPAAGTSFSGTTTVTITATDASGNSKSCNFDVSVQDVLNPTVTCPSNATLAADGSCTAVLPDYTSTAVGDDNCSAPANLVYSQNPAPSAVLPAGSQPVTITVTDQAGNTGTCIFTVTVTDQSAPVAICPGNQTVIADANCSATIGDYTSLVSASDNCSSLGNLVIGQTPAPGSTIFTDTQITLSVTDQSSNTGTCVFNVILQDTIDPVITTCPGDQLLSINSSCEYTVPDLSGLVAGSDNCSAWGTMLITQNPPAGSTENGVTPVIITLTDGQGNAVSCLTNLLPDDVTAPSITCPTPAPMNVGNACDFILPFYGSTANVLDNCSNYSIAQTPPQGSTVNTGNNTIILVVTDAGGNTDQCSFTLSVIENEAPVITCPSDISTCNPVITYSDPVYSDNCAASLLQTDGTGLSSGMTFPAGITTLEYTAIDSSGNTQTCSFNVEVLDFPSPAVIADDTIELCNLNSTIIQADAITGGSGLWTLESGQGTFNNQFSNITGVNNLGFGVNVFAWTVSSASCGTNSDTLVVINSQQDLMASTQDTIITCAQPQILLQANTPLYGIGTWTTDGGATISNIHSSNTTANLLNSGWQSFVWTISNGGCPPSSDTLLVLGNLPPDILTSDTSVCLTDEAFPINGVPALNGTSTFWEVSYGQGQLENPGAAGTSVTNLDFGPNILVYHSAYPGCPTVTDTLLLIGELCEGTDPVLPTVITPNFDGKNDLFVINFLEKLYPDCHVVIFNRWGSVVFESTGYAEPWDGTYKGEPLPMGTYFYSIELNDPDHKVLKGDISIIH